jgi:ABC-type oligopeptide transport system substrate-binding subunit
MWLVYQTWINIMKKSIKFLSALALVMAMSPLAAQAQQAASQPAAQQHTQTSAHHANNTSYANNGGVIVQSNDVFPGSFGG